ncbi:hypothetical protein ACEWY4_010931 [Coilia grayii]|uniref:Peptidase S8 pro-domain domain-containing protein n=1 Tax=Coilia grayii TaxID=363190 RepID=A0ABD1K3D1_9TELE
MWARRHAEPGLTDEVRVPFVHGSSIRRQTTSDTSCIRLLHSSLQGSSSLCPALPCLHLSLHPSIRPAARDPAPLFMDAWPRLLHTGAPPLPLHLHLHLLLLLLVLQLPLKTLGDHGAGATTTTTTISASNSPSHPTGVYSNSWAVHVSGGAHQADRIARKHGFVNHGNLSGSQLYLCFEPNVGLHSRLCSAPAPALPPSLLPGDLSSSGLRTAQRPTELLCAVPAGAVPALLQSSVQGPVLSGRSVVYCTALRAWGKLWEYLF